MARQTKQVFETILVAYDDSPQSQTAMDLAFSLAEAMWSKLLIFALIHPPEPAGRVKLNAVLEEAREHDEQSFISLREQAKLTGVEIETDIAVGHPAERIVHRAEQANVSLIVMGRRGMSIFPRRLHGPQHQTLDCPYTRTSRRRSLS
jgi:nucleotide-binding universal stress UspA family protein